MYLPAAFQETREDVLAALVREWPFATLVAAGAAGPAAEHVPLLLTADGALRGHVAAGNALAGADGVAVLAIFHGPHGYVSPNWYRTQHETAREVPTWNYAVVHVHGRLRVRRERGWLLALLDALTERHEAGLPQPWCMADAPAGHIERQLDAIAGLEIEVERMVGKFKLSQNHPARNRRGVIQGLRRRAGTSDDALAALMAARDPEAGT